MGPSRPAPPPPVATGSLTGVKSHSSPAGDMLCPGRNEKRYTPCCWSEGFLREAMHPVRMTVDFRVRKTRVRVRTPPPPPAVWTCTLHATQNLLEPLLFSF